MELFRDKETVPEKDRRALKKIKPLFKNPFRDRVNCKIKCRLTEITGEGVGQHSFRNFEICRNVFCHKSLLGEGDKTDSDVSVTALFCIGIIP